MDETEFRKVMEEIRAGLASQMPEHEGGINAYFAQMIDRAIALKNSGAKDFPKSFTGFATWLSEDRWLWPVLSRVRNALIDFMDLPREKN